jgi:hypothetical protein
MSIFEANNLYKSQTVWQEDGEKYTEEKFIICTLSYLLRRLNDGDKVQQEWGKWVMTREV